MLVRAGRSYSGHERNRCFLNVYGNQFANASMLCGFDLPEDGRAIAICDWDQDGALDFWVANRTAPQLRLMKNDCPAKGNHVTFVLEGTRSNRDAVGARVLAITASGKKLSRTVRAGEGFLGCSSRRIHFGLGTETKVEQLSVRWPDGKHEPFGSVDANTTWRLTEGRGNPVKLEVEPQKVSGETVAPPEQSMAAHNLLNAPMPCPPLEFQAWDGRRFDLSMESEQPTLVSLWATWCQPCVLELAEWSRSGELTSKVRIVPVCVDSLSGDKASADANDLSTAVPAELLTSLGLAQHAGEATSTLLDTIQHVHNVVYDHHRPLPVPTSLLIDRRGQLRALCKGSVPAERILADVGRLDEEDELVGLPFEGRWLGGLRNHNLALVIEDLFQAGYEDVAIAYTDRLGSNSTRPAQIRARLFLAEQLESRDPTAASSQLQAVFGVEPNNAQAHERLALILARNQQQSEAIGHFESALKHSEPRKTPSTRSIESTHVAKRTNRFPRRQTLTEIPARPNGSTSTSAREVPSLECRATF